MLNLVIAVAFAISPAQAQFWGEGRKGQSATDTIKGLLKQVAIVGASKKLEGALNRRETVAPVRAGEGLGRVTVTRADGYRGWYDADLLSTWTESALREVGFEAISRKGRKIVAGEMRETRSPEFNPATAQPLGQLNGSELFCIVTAREGRGDDRRVRVNEGRVTVSTDTRAEWACVTIQLVDVTGAIVASAEAEASDSTTGLESRVGAWGRGTQYASRRATRRDLAVVVAVVKATNAIGQQIAQRRAGANFDPITGKPVRQSACPVCQKLSQSGDRFCSGCGVKFLEGAPSALLSESEFAPQFVGKGEE